MHCHALTYCVALEFDKQKEKEKEDGYHGMVDLAQNFYVEYFIIFQIQNQQNWRKLSECLANLLFDNHLDCQGNLFPSKIL